MPNELLSCDGCGQVASPAHIARRLRRLEWTTRYRPVHIGTLLLGAVSPQADADFLYAGEFAGEATRLLEAAGIVPSGKTADGVLSEFQRSGYFLAHVLECPLEDGTINESSVEKLLLQRASSVVARIRRSLKPKRTVLIGEQLASIAGKLSTNELGCPVILDDGKPFALEPSVHAESFRKLREALLGAATAR